MHKRRGELVGPLYLFACLILGGSAQGIWQNMVLQLVGIILISWAAMTLDEEPLAPPARQLLLIGAVGIAIVALQLIPLSPALWPRLGGRASLAEDFRTLGLAVPPQTVSLAPYSSLNSLLGIIPALAMFCAMVRLKAYRPTLLAGALLAGTIAGVLLGALQVASSGAADSPWYLYAETNAGLGVGFFANVNHMAILLVICLPFLAAMSAAAKGADMQRYSAAVALTIGAGLVIVVGIALNHSLAAYGLAFPAVAASALIVLPPGNRWRIWSVTLAAVLLVAALGALVTSSISGGGLGKATTTAVQTRQEITQTSVKAIRGFLPLGSGLGSFQSVYHLYERPDQVDTTYVIHAHDDYLELMLELGIAGAILIVLFLVWWTAAVWRVWRTVEPAPFARAASIASGAILVHSIVDFPLRTAAISACFAMCAALLADRRSPQVQEESDFRPARHMVLR